jgi:hypothetical protein
MFAGRSQSGRFDKSMQHYCNQINGQQRSKLRETEALEKVLVLIISHRYSNNERREVEVLRY